jgi:hypothetical protein
MTLDAAASALAGAAHDVAEMAQKKGLDHRKKLLEDEIAGKGGPLLRIGGGTPQEQLAKVNQELADLENFRANRIAAADKNSIVGIAKQGRDAAKKKFAEDVEKAKDSEPEQEQEKKKTVENIKQAAKAREQQEINAGWDDLNRMGVDRPLAEVEAQSKRLKARQRDLNEAHIMGPPKALANAPEPAWVGEREKKAAQMDAEFAQQKQPFKELFAAGLERAQKEDRQDWEMARKPWEAEGERAVAGPKEERMNAALRVAGGNHQRAAELAGLVGAAGAKPVPVEFGFSGLQELSKSIQMGLSEKAEDKNLAALEEANKQRGGIVDDTKLIKDAIVNLDKNWGMFN